MFVPHRSRRRIAVALAIVTGCALLGFPGVAAGSGASEAAERVAMMERARAAARQSPDAQPQRRLSAAGCFDDPSGDTARLVGGEPQPEAFGPADIVEYCVGFGDTLSLSVEVLEPTDPLTHPAWAGITFVGWFLDTGGDDVGDFLVTYRRNAGGQLEARVDDLRGDDAELVCQPDASFTDDAYRVDNIPAACIGDPDEVAVNPAVFFDEDGDGDPDGDDLYMDTAPNTADFAPPVPAGRTTQAGRIFGANRFETAVRIAQRQFPDGAPVVYLAEAALFADAVAGGILTDGPILLVPSDGEVPAVVTAEVDRQDPDQVIALGGVNAIDDAVLAASAGTRDTGRVFGVGRIQTAVAISQREFAGGADEVYLARADFFADAVVGGVLTDGPILLVPSAGQVPPEVTDEIGRLDPETVTALGGDQAIEGGVLEGAAGARATNRLFGASRIETAVAISEFQFGGTTVDSSYLARADVFADAVVGGTLTDGPILLVPSCGDVPSAVGLQLQARDAATVFALGGEQAVCEQILQDAASL